MDNFTIRSSQGALFITQPVVDKLLIDLIIQENLPLSLVEKSSFKKFATLGLPSSVSIMCRKTLRSKIVSTHQHMLTKLTATLSKIKYVCTTTDLWSKGKRFFFYFIFLKQRN